MREKKTIRWQTMFKHGVLLVISFFWVYPFLWMTAAAFKTDGEFWGNKFGLIPKEWTFGNISRVWNMAHFDTYFMNTLIITVCSVALVMVMTNLSGYVLGRYSFIGKKLLMGIFLSSIAIPLTTTIIPVYQIIKSMGLIGTKTGVILAGAGGAHVIFILLYSSFYSQVPLELEEAAKIDGCNALKTLWYVIVPMLKPSLVSCALFQFMWTSNDFMGPLIYISDMPKYTNSIYLRMSMDGDVGFQWNRILAMSLISIIPSLIVFFCAQDSFIDGIAAGGVKG